jgi:hypothetical protein
MSNKGYTHCPQSQHQRTAGDSVSLLVRKIFGDPHRIVSTPGFDG